MDQQEEQSLQYVDEVDQPGHPEDGGSTHDVTADEDANLTLPPPLTPNRPGDHSNDILHLIQYMQHSTIQEQTRRRQEE